MLIERFQNKSSLERRRKQFPLAAAHAYSSDGFLLSIQFIGQLGLKRPVLRKFCVPATHSGQGSLSMDLFFRKNGDCTGLRGVARSGKSERRGEAPRRMAREENIHENESAKSHLEVALNDGGGVGGPGDACPRTD